MVAPVAGQGPEDRAAAAPDRVLAVAGARAAGVLLLPELLARVGDLAPALGLDRALALVRGVHVHRVLERAPEDLLAERRAVELGRTELAAHVALDLHRAQPFLILGVRARQTCTKPLVGPAIVPLR